MKKRVRSVFACIAALAMCSCASQTELDKAKAEADAAREEAWRAKAEAEGLRAKIKAEEKVKADAEAAKAKAKADAEAANGKAAALEEELRTRWNAAPAASANVPLPNFGQVNFTWKGSNAFPHPTFKGGSKEAYTAFAKVLVAFLETGDNFEFMQKNDLFNVNLGFGGTGKIKISEFATQLAQPNSLGSGDEDTRKKLETLVAKMKAPRKL